MSFNLLYTNSFQFSSASFSKLALNFSSAGILGILKL